MKGLNQYTFADADDFHNGYASVQHNGLWGFINKSGEITVPCIYEEINQFHEGYAKVKKNGN